MSSMMSDGMIVGGGKEWESFVQRISITPNYTSIGL